MLGKVIAVVWPTVLPGEDNGEEKDQVLDIQSSVSQQLIPSTIPPPSSCSSGSFGRCEASARFACLLTHDQTPLAAHTTHCCLPMEALTVRALVPVHHLPMPGAEELRTGELGALYWLFSGARIPPQSLH